jgi:hypothetical protein
MIRLPPIHLFKVEAVRISDSLGSPLLTPIVGPSVEGKRVAATKKEQGLRHKPRPATSGEAFPWSASADTPAGAMKPTWNTSTHGRGGRDEEDRAC